MVAEAVNHNFHLVDQQVQLVVQVEEQVVMPLVELLEVLEIPLQLLFHKEIMEVLVEIVDQLIQAVVEEEQVL